MFYISRIKYTLEARDLLNAEFPCPYKRSSEEPPQKDTG